MREQGVDCGVADLGHQIRALREVVVADDDGRIGPKRLMDRPQAAARGRPIDQVIVDQGRVMDELDRHRGGMNVVEAWRLAESGRQENQRRPESLATGLEDLLHRVRHRSEVGFDRRVQPLFEVVELGANGNGKVDSGHGRTHAAPSRPVIASTNSSRTVVIGGRSWPNRILAVLVKRSGEPVT